MPSVGCPEMMPDRRANRGRKAVYQAAENPNDITVTHEFASVEAAQAFLNSDELKKARQCGGVVGAPTIWFTNKK
jgi:hypothetical protein